MDFNAMPKLICDAWHLNNNRVWFFFGFTSGTDKSALLLSPKGAKGFLLELQKRITKYEKDHGEIDMTGHQAGIQSPIQIKPE